MFPTATPSRGSQYADTRFQGTGDVRVCPVVGSRGRIVTLRIRLFSSLLVLTFLISHNTDLFACCGRVGQNPLLSLITLFNLLVTVTVRVGDVAATSKDQNYSPKH